MSKSKRSGFGFEEAATKISLSILATDADIVIFNDELTIDEIVNNAIEARLIEENTFAFSLAQLTYEHIDEIDDIINANSVGWKVERLPKVSLAIMRLAICEILYVPSVPSGVSINEAVELAKKFSSQEDASFINGILGKYVRENETE